MKATIASTESSRLYQRKRMAFISFLVISPILPYMITMAYNSLVFAKTRAETRLLPSFPQAKLIESNVYQDYSSNRCLEWMFRYITNATPKEVGAFYETALLNTGWHRSGGFSGFERYAKSATNILVDYDDVGKIVISVTANVFPIFEPRCAP